MRSVTSCFNFTLYRKTMARFWPVWVAYGAVWVFLFPLNMLNQYFDSLRYSDNAVSARAELLECLEDIPASLEGGVWVACFAGVLAVMAVFGYLYNNRSAGMMHTLPMRRETLFCTQYLAGLSFLLLPHLVVSLLVSAVIFSLLLPGVWAEAFGYLATWLLVQSGNSLFFYSFAVFCAMFTGNILALPAFYGILNGLVAGIYALITALMEFLFYGFPGVSGNNRFVEYCTPVWALFEAGDWRVVRSGTANDSYYSTSQWYLESPETVAAYAAAGVVLALLALAVYRRRHVESAGDVVSVAVVRPIFRAGVAVCTGLAFGIFTASFFGWSDVVSLSACVVIWSLVGWFVAEMLLKKSFRVLRSWRGAAVHGVAMVLLCLAVCLDWFGIESRVPRMDQVESVQIHANLGAPYDGGNFDLNALTDPEGMAQVITLHQALVNQGDRRGIPGESYISVRLAYRLKNGSTLERHYWSVPIQRAEVEQEGSVAWAANQLNQNRDLVEQCYGFDRYEDWRIVEAFLTNVYTDDESLHEERKSDFFLDASGEELKELWQAVRQDFDEGTIGVRYLFDDNERRANTYESDLCFVLENPESEWEWKQQAAASSSVAVSEHFSITMTPNAGHTLDWLEEHTQYERADSRFFSEHKLYDD